MIARILVIRIEMVMETMKLVWDDDGNKECRIGMVMATKKSRLERRLQRSKDWVGDGNKEVKISLVMATKKLGLGW